MMYSVEYKPEYLPYASDASGEPTLMGDESFEACGSIFRTLKDAVEAVLSFYEEDSVENLLKHAGAESLEINVVGRPIVVHVTGYKRDE